MAWVELLAAFGHATYSVAEVMGLVPELMQRYGLNSYDAIHAATAIKAGVSTVLATDAEFANVPAARFALITDNSRLVGCRRRRSR